MRKRVSAEVKALRAEIASLKLQVSMLEAMLSYEQNRIPQPILPHEPYPPYVRPWDEGIHPYPNYPAYPYIWCSTDTGGLPINGERYV